MKLRHADLLFAHITPTSSLCVQSETPQGLVLHCKILVSVPRQVTSSNRIGPAPLPNRGVGENRNGEVRTAVALFLKQSHQIVSAVKSRTRVIQ